MSPAFSLQLLNLARLVVILNFTLLSLAFTWGLRIPLPQVWVLIDRTGGMNLKGAHARIAMEPL